MTYRVAAHSTSDDPSAYRPKEESDAWPLGDPIERLKQHLFHRGVWTQKQHDQARERLENEVQDAQKEAEQYGTLKDGPKPSSRDMFEGVFETMPEHLRRQRQEMGV